MSAPPPVRRLLLVEDNPGDADYISELLAEPSQHPHDISFARSMAEAVAALKAGDFDAVLLDLTLPDCTGTDSVDRVRALAPDTPIVILTGREDAAVALDCLAAGAQDYLAKSEMRERGINRAIHYAVARTLEGAARRKVVALRNHLAAIVEASLDAIVSVDLEGTVTAWNGGAERVFGWSRPEAIGAHVSALIRPPDAAARIEQARVIEAFPRSEDRASAYEVTRLDRANRPLVLSVVSCRLRDADGAVTGLASICRDVTEQRARDQALLRQNRELHALAARLNQVREEERTRISREVHDELGQFLTGLKMDLQWMSRRLQPDEAQAQVQTRIVESMRLVDRTIESVQRIAIELRPSALDALGLSAALRDEARRFEKRTGIASRVEINAAGKPGPEVATALFRVLQELMTNVARHAKANSVTVALDEDRAGWAMRVIDDGIGIAPEAQRQRSMGLVGAAERLEAVGGSLELLQGEAGGTVAIARVPRP